jgi:3-hydroxyisobutyrate dehydrogenase-like beta-hydroxyacid dehydrogenase
MDKVVGLVGFGIMVSAMAHNLRQAGYEVVGYDSVPVARARLREMGDATRALREMRLGSSGTALSITKGCPLPY